MWWKEETVIPGCKGREGWVASGAALCIKEGAESQKLDHVQSVNSSIESLQGISSNVGSHTVASLIKYCYIGSCLYGVALAILDTQHVDFREF